MSAPAATPPATEAPAAGDSPGGGPDGGPSRGTGALGWLRRHRVGVVAVVLALLAVVVVALTSGGEEANDTPLDPANPGPDGARAVARVLADQGVDVEVVRSADALDDALASSDDDTGVVVTSTDQLGQSTAERLRDAVDGRPLVLVQPGVTALRYLGLRARPVTVEPGESIDAACSQQVGDPDLAGLDDLVDGLTVEVDSAQAYSRVGGCFAVDGEPTLARTGTTTVVGLADALTNEQVLRGDDAALALRLLGQDDRLVWYVPTYADLAPDDSAGTLSSFAPGWFVPGLWLCGAGVLALMLWRGRRLGPLAVEPLPVVVRAVETTRSRGRLYRRANDRGHAAARLRAASRRRARRRLRLGGDADASAVVEAVAQHTARPASEVAALLVDAPPPASDRALIDLATALDRLDEEVSSR